MGHQIKGVDRTSDELLSKDPISLFLINQNINTWTQLASKVRHLPYGRISNKMDLKLVLTERKGTCSTKHALLKLVADLNEITGIALYICIYKMTVDNTPGIDVQLSTYNLTYIPEAHCYLKINGEALDVTSSDSNFDAIKSSIIQEVEISPGQINDFKYNYHRNFLARWIAQEGLTLSLDEVWTIRESCIANLSGQR